LFEGDDLSALPAEGIAPRIRCAKLSHSTFYKLERGLTMQFTRVWVMVGALFLATSGLYSGNVLAEVGITDNCQDDIDKLQDEIKDDKDKFTAESRRKAKAELAVARTNRLDPIKCRKNIQDARQELRQGNRDKKDD
jgi:hypothetical protein